MYTFQWKHGEEFIQLPLKITKSVDSGYGMSGQLICNACNGNLKQTYKCSCGQEYTIGDIKKRKDKETEVVYDFAERKAYMSQSIEQSIKVVGEFSLEELAPNVEFLLDKYEIYNNKDSLSMKTIGKIHKWLRNHKKGLLVEFGFREKYRAGIVIAGANKLLLVEILDHRLIRIPKQQELETTETEVKTVLNAISEDRAPEVHMEYIERIRNGDTVDVEVPEREVQRVVVVENSFLDD